MCDVVGNVEDLKVDNEDSDGNRVVVRGVTEEPTDVGGVSNDKDNDKDDDDIDEDEGPTTVEAASATVINVADKGLHEEVEDWAADPNDAGTLMGDS